LPGGAISDERPTVVSDAEFFENLSVFTGRQARDFNGINYPPILDNNRVNPPCRSR
jgi:hypothetical protein